MGSNHINTKNDCAGQVSHRQGKVIHTPSHFM